MTISAATILSWTESRVEQLKTLFMSGYSSSQIAAEMGLATRNAVIGKLHRLGLGENDRQNVKKVVAPRAPRAPRKPQQPKLKPSRYAYSVAPEGFVPEPVEVRHAAVEPLHLDLMQLNDQVCHYPYGDGPFTFCGCPVISGPYCPAHHVITHQPPQKRVLKFEKSFPRSFAGGGGRGPRMFA